MKTTIRKNGWKVMELRGNTVRPNVRGYIDPHTKKVIPLGFQPTFKGGREVAMEFLGKLILSVVMFCAICFGAVVISTIILNVMSTIF